jgi:secreted trypsin-like serine protease
MVSLNHAENKQPFCGGALIHPSWVLTAANCIGNSQDLPLKTTDIFVVVGLYRQSHIGNEGEQLAVKQIIQHPEWRNAAADSWADVALLELATPTKYPPVALTDKDSLAILPGKIATVLGWGKTSTAPNNNGSDILQQVEIPIVSNEVCQAAYATEPDPILDTMVCAGLPGGGKDACTGDSGGPLVVLENNEWKLFGIVSYGGKEGGPDCAGPDAYGVYIRLPSYLDFINAHVPATTPATAVNYDGIWQSTALPNTFVILRSVEKTLAIVLLSDNGQSWHALVGNVQQPVTTVTGYISSTEIVATFRPHTTTTAESVTAASFTIATCRPKPDQANAHCPLPAGTTVQLEKMF